MKKSITNENETFWELAQGIRRTLAKKYHALSATQLLSVVVLIFLVTAGSAMQTIGLNFWLRKFPDTPGSFTVLISSAFLFGSFFTVLLILYMLWKRPCMKFAASWKGLRLLFFIGLMDAANSVMSIYAATDTPELLQPLFSSLMPLYACIFSKYVLKDERTYLNKWIVSSFSLMILSVVIASLNEFESDWDADEHGRRTKWWSLIFFLSIPPTSLMNVLQTKYMIMFTKQHQLEEIDLRQSSQSFDDESSNASGAHKGEDTIVKLVLLCADTNFQLLFVTLLLPMDAVSWWGQSTSLPNAWGNFLDGIRCLINCDENFLFCMVYSAGFVFTYVGSAYLNHYSPTLCGMIGQLSSPITALVLVLIPSWNLNQGSAPWLDSVLAIVALAVGTLLYSMWEEMTSSQSPEALADADASYDQEMGERQPLSATTCKTYS